MRFYLNHSPPSNSVELQQADKDSDVTMPIGVVIHCHVFNWKTGSCRQEKKKKKTVHAMAAR